MVSRYLTKYINKAEPVSQMFTDVINAHLVSVHIGQPGNLAYQAITRATRNTLASRTVSLQEANPCLLGGQLVQTNAFTFKINLDKVAFLHLRLYP